MKMIEERLRNDLNAEFAPDNALNRSILNQAKENYEMKRNHWKARVSAAAVAACIAVGSLSAYAAYRYLSPSQVAERAAGEQALAKAFESESAVLVNETQRTGEYDVTFLGIVSGKDLKGAFEDPAKVQEKRTYAVTAIARADGTPMPEGMDPDYNTFCVSPLIHGKTFSESNNGVLDAGIFAFVQDGIQYELLECDDLEIFAGKGVSLGVVESFGEETSAFLYDETTGSYSRNTAYEGVNALFELPLDLEKADEAAAEAYFKDVQESQPEEDEDLSLTGNEQADEWINFAWKAADSTQKAWEEFKQRSKELTEYAQTVTPDTEGYIHYRTNDGESENVYYVGDDLREAGVEICDRAESDGTYEGTRVFTVTRNEDGSFTLRCYAPEV